MPKAFSVDLRLRVLAAVENGLTCRRAAEMFGVSRAAILNWRALERRRGGVQPKPMGGDTRSWRIEAERDTIFALLERNPKLTASALRRALEARGLVFSYHAVQNFAKRNGIELARGPGGRRKTGAWQPPAPASRQS